MTEVSPSPDVFLGKRRSSLGEACEMSEDTFSAHMKRYKVNVNRSNRMSMDSTNDEEQGNQKRIRNNGYGESSESANSTNGLTAAASEQIQRYHESVLSSIRMEHQMALARKDQEIQHISNENKTMTARCHAMINEHNSCLEENRLLKKAVGIQDGRYRELSANYDQLQHVMGRAAQHIAMLEKKNEELSEQVHSMMFSGNNSNFRPPDVY
jgi:hypothetical protein